MDLKILRQDISVNHVAFSQSAEQSVDMDFTLPDYYPEISKILKCKAVPRVASCGINGQTLMLEGSISISVMYLSAMGEISSYEQTVPFSKGFELDTDSSGCTPVCKAKSEYINCRAVSDRKIEVHGAVGLYVKALKKVNTQIITDVDGADVVLNRGIAPATSPIGITEKSLMIEEELELGSGQPSIRYLLRYDAKAANKECKIISGKVVVKGEVSVYALYCAEGSSKPQCFRSVIPYSQLLDIEGINDTCEIDCRVEVAQLEMKPRTAASGETKSIMLCCKLRILASACCNNDIPVVFDAYSTKYEADVSTKEIAFEKIAKNINESFVCKKNLELTAGDVDSVADLWCETQVNSSRVENGQLLIGGTLLICMLIFMNEAGPVYQERPIDFEYKCPVEHFEDGMYCDPSVTAERVSYTLLGGNNLEVTAEMCVNAAVNIRKRASLVVEVDVDEQKVKQPVRDSALIIYYADAGEKVWDIARRYNSSPDEISEINCIETPALIAPKTLLIPVK